MGLHRTNASTKSKHCPKEIHRRSGRRTRDLHRRRDRDLHRATDTKFGTQERRERLSTRHSGGYKEKLGTQRRREDFGTNPPRNQRARTKSPDREEEGTTDAKLETKKKEFSTRHIGGFIERIGTHRRRENFGAKPPRRPRARTKSPDRQEEGTTDAKLETKKKRFSTRHIGGYIEKIGTQRRRENFGAKPPRRPRARTESPDREKEGTTDAKLDTQRRRERFSTRHIRGYKEKTRNEGRTAAPNHQEDQEPGPRVQNAQ